MQMETTMKLFEYLKWRYEEKERKAKINKIEKMEEELAELCGEVEGLSEQIKILQIADRDLVFSTAGKQCDLMAKYTKAVSRKTWLGIKLADLRK